MNGMTDPTPEQWAQLGKELIGRRVELGFRTRAAFAKARGYKNDRTISAIENAERTNFAQQTLAAFEVDYRWAPGSISEVLAGRPPFVLDDTGLAAIGRPAVESLTDMELLSELGRRLSRRVESDDVDVAQMAQVNRRDSKFRLVDSPDVSEVDDRLGAAALETEPGLDELPGGSDPNE